jgi:hypothetical protein
MSISAACCRGAAGAWGGAGEDGEGGAGILQPRMELIFTKEDGDDEEARDADSLCDSPT